LFTATAVMQLAEQGRVDLDSPVAMYLPERVLEKNGRRATVRHLLSHTVGLPNPIPITWVHLLGENGPGLDALTDRLIGKRPRLAFAPGTKSVYSNLGYLLLGQLVERLAGKGFAAYVEQHVLEPLGCQATAFVPAVGAAIGHQRRLSFMGLAARWMLDGRFFGEAEGGYWTLRPFAVDGAPYGGLFGPMPDLGSC
jgi:CubicO group peptidase (beta-lactamase class C family)